jgi:hypothetical protein
MALTASAPAKSTAHMHDHPVSAFIWGCVFLFPALCGITVQLTTSEAWFHGASVAVSIAPHFAILAQPRDFFQGHMSVADSEAFIYAFGIEAVQLLVATGFIVGTMAHNRFASWVFFIGSLVLVVLNSIADFKFNGAANGWQQAGFTVVLFVVSAGLTYYALHLILTKGILAAWRMWAPGGWQGRLLATGILALLLFGFVLLCQHALR